MFLIETLHIDGGHRNRFLRDRIKESELVSILRNPDFKIEISWVGAPNESNIPDFQVFSFSDKDLELEEHGAWRDVHNFNE